MGCTNCSVVLPAEKLFQFSIHVNETGANPVIEVGHFASCTNNPLQIPDWKHDDVVLLVQNTVFHHK